MMYERDRQHHQALDGLRGLAALSVVLAHFLAAFLPATLYRHYPGVFPAPLPATLEAALSFPLLAVFYNGLFPVAIFFVLSGYVLALPYWSENRNLLLRRLWTRYIRLNIPIATATLISFSMLALGLYFNVEASKYSQSWWLSLYFTDATPDYPDLAQQLIYKGVSGDIKYDPPLWTLGIELFGSMILLAYFALKPTSRDFFALAASAIFLILLTVALAILTPGSLLWYLSIIVGGYLGAFKLHNKYLLAGLFGLGFYFGSYVDGSNVFSFLPNVARAQQFYNVFGAILIVAAVVNGFGASVLRSSVCQWLGKASFPVYLFHFIVLCSAASYLYMLLDENSWQLSLTFIGYIVCCYAVAAIFVFVDSIAIAVSTSLGVRLFPG